MLRWWLALALLWTAPSWAQDLLPVPPLTARVIDQTGTLQPAQAAALEAKLAAFEAEAGPQIVVLMVASTLPEDIAAYAQRVGDSWKIGRREVGDGLLIVVAKNDRRINIQTAKALEGAVPDLAARQVIDRAIKPAFRADDYAGGLDAALDMLMARIRGEALPAPAARSQGQGGSGLQLQELLIFFFIAVPVIGSVFTRALGRRFGAVVSAGAAGGIAGWLTSSVLLGLGAGLVALLLVGLFGIGAVSRALSQAGRGRHGGSVPWTTGGWSSGGGGGGWGGGGFSSGGGGDFGGGGASGDW